VYLWPTLFKDVCSGKLYVRDSHVNQVVERFAPGQRKWTPVRKLIGSLYVRWGTPFFDWDGCFERVA